MFKSGIPYRRIIIIAGLVLAGGIALALPFRKPAAQLPQPDAPATAIDGPGLTADPSANARSAVPLAVVPSGSSLPVIVVQRGSAAANSDKPGGTEPKVSSIPSLRSDKPDTPRETVARLAADYASLGDLARSELAREPRTNEDGAAEVRHTIVDGDTLAALAEFYLGSEDQQAVIFQRNRDLLDDPHLLPIGLEIVIPGD